MGYSKSKLTLDKNRHLLKQWEETGVYPTWDVREGSADYFAYKVREMLYIARLYPTDYPRLAAFADSSRVVVTSPSHIEIKSAVGTPEAKASTQTAGVVVQGLANAGHESEQQSVTTAQQIMDAWKAKQPSNERMPFPNAKLDHAELIKLYQWASKLTPPWLMFEVGGSVTLQKYSRDMADMSWTPADIVERV